LRLWLGIHFMLLEYVHAYLCPFKQLLCYGNDCSFDTSKR
jgi:hypothetical protein